MLRVSSYALGARSTHYRPKTQASGLFWPGMVVAGGWDGGWWGRRGYIFSSDRGESNIQLAFDNLIPKAFDFQIKKH